MTVPRQTAHVDSPTERRNPSTTMIDQVSTVDILWMINNEDAKVPGAVAATLPQLSAAVDLATEALLAGNRIHYVGAGTSGRLATLDAAELIPTFTIPADWVQVHHAGGSSALRTSAEGAEDDELGAAEEMARDVRAGDFVLGLTASGRTPYVIGALCAAHERGATTALVTNNPNAATTSQIDIEIVVDTGPEVISGSTRMKAGTAQKLVLTSFSTAVMVKMGRTYSNLMVSMRANNAKLRGRTLRILGEATGMSQPECSAALTESRGDLKVALVHLLSGVDTPSAERALAETDGSVRQALGLLNAHAS